MKTIGVVTDGNTSLDIFLKKNLKLVFSDYIRINTYFLKSLKKGYIIEDDLVLTMTDQRALAVKQYVKDSKKIIVINRTIMEKEIYKLFLIPNNTNVLVVNDNEETTFETVSLLYRIGVDHLNLIPYDPSKQYSDIDIEIAITPGEVNRVPKHIKKIIDLGHRCIDVSTFLTIMSKLNIDNEEISKKLIEYSEKVVSLDTGIKSKYKELYTKKEDLNMIVNLSNDGIVLTSEDGSISVYNKSFEKIFKTQGNLYGCKINKIFQGELKRLLSKEELKDEVIKYKNKYLNINKRCINEFGKKKREYYNIQEITYIKKLEQNLSSKLREKGHIAKYTFKDIKTISKSMKKCIELAEKIATSDLTVLITGESGTGKEVFAQSIHNKSHRRNQPFVAVNCAAMPENLLESELFGYVGGAFTGALKEGKAGLFEQANNGTLFLDEVGDMPIQLQTKLLRVLQEKQVMRIGADKIFEIDVRVISATNRNLIQMVREKKFRADLYYRLNVLPINIPPLRERKEDIILLLKYFLGREIKIDKKARKVLEEYNWPGNIRELWNVSSYISLMCKKDIIEIEDLPHYLMPTNESSNYNNCNEQIILSDISLKVLEIIYNHNIKGIPIGRNSILKILLNEDVITTEGEVRKILSDLKNLGLITSYVGRGGSKITDKGKKYLVK